MDNTGRPLSERARRRTVRSTEDALARPPQEVPASSWVLPSPEEADEDGVVGIGADLAPATLVDAYSRGIFPWPHPGVPLPWFSPDPRGVLRFDDLHVSRSLRRTFRRCGWTTTVDEAFEAVVEGCATGRGEAGTWITPAMARAYAELHDLGWAHSVEVWDRDDLVGGLYGVQIGGVFTGESMFHRRSDASKVAMVELIVRLRAAGGRLLDVQLQTDHLATMGATTMPRGRFLEELSVAGRHEVRLRTARRPASRLEDLAA